MKTKREQFKDLASAWDVETKRTGHTDETRQEMHQRRMAQFWKLWDAPESEKVKPADPDDECPI